MSAITKFVTDTAINIFRMFSIEKLYVTDEITFLVVYTGFEISTEGESCDL